ncbi:MAG: hypothetical protein WCO35_03380 [Candidatus Nomurabacteria bacterium]
MKDFIEFLCLTQLLQNDSFKSVTIFYHLIKQTNMRQIIVVLLTVFLFYSCGKKNFPYQIVNRNGKSLVIDSLTKKTFYTLNNNTVKYPKEVDSLLRNNLTKIILPGDSLVLVKDLSSETIYVSNPKEEKKKEDQTKLFIILTAISILSICMVHPFICDKKSVAIWIFFSISLLSEWFAIQAIQLIENRQSTSYIFCWMSFILIVLSFFMIYKKEKSIFNVLLFFILLTEIISIVYLLK